MFEAIKRMFARADAWEDKLTIEEVGPNEFYIIRDGERYAGPYGREKDAKGQITRMKRSYTPAARRP